MLTVLDPRLLAAMQGLALSARHIAAGSLSGLHASRRTGLAREFSQYRPYLPGDDPRHVDWKLYARSDRYFVRESDVETALTLRLILDATASMRQAGSTGPGTEIRKFDAARSLVAALAHLGQAQGDRVGLHLVRDEKVISIPPAQKGQPLARILHTLERLEPAGRWPVDPRTFQRAVGFDRRTAPRAQTREISVVLTDGHEHGVEIRAALAPLQTPGHELILFHLVGKDEMEFPYEGPVRFEDLETGETIETDAGAARVGFLADQREQMDAWRRAGAGSGRFDYVCFRLDEPLERTLRSYLIQRR